MHVKGLFACDETKRQMSSAETDAGPLNHLTGFCFFKLYSLCFTFQTPVISLPWEKFATKFVKSATVETNLLETAILIQAEEVGLTLNINTSLTANFLINKASVSKDTQNTPP